MRFTPCREGARRCVNITIDACFATTRSPLAIGRERRDHCRTTAPESPIVDSSDQTDRVYDFCRGRAARKVFPGKGAAGSRPAVELSRTRFKAGIRLLVLGVDGLKSQVFDRISRGRELTSVIP
jgi:hypothetical protein